MTTPGRRRGSDTRAEIREVALELFTRQGYEATSLREIAERLGITKAALYYHFKNKDDIVRSLFSDHLKALDGLLDWAREQPLGPELRRAVVDRMVALMTGEGRSVMRFALANQRVMRDLRPDEGASAFERLAELGSVVLGPDAPAEDVLRLRSALLSANIVLLAAHDLDTSDADIVRVTRDIAQRLVADLDGDTTGAG
ncbi:TetR/AcrR family transcriptional regulator [Streptomyces sp. NPDC088785]|uniref:TetR/AcrR family transcriptional regulator n=1 Tax=Streptomyces sp. NPDC088785 TaxID=3365897 RepID=UPI0038059E19